MQRSYHVEIYSLCPPFWEKGVSLYCYYYYCRDDDSQDGRFNVLSEARSVLDEHLDTLRGSWNTISGMTLQNGFKAGERATNPKGGREKYDLVCGARGGEEGQRVLMRYGD
ncbi:hypothetical protein EVAR_699_1 [Eumeta japonica]|uniref:Uncharacterized protein n=1 Tax=Eumeta variegata TaxID=151549 RepID=A0A4C1SBQ6_EUMVA|nr:hypothetical protein EVAR_699_1 [Eumeta japonica]